MLKGWAWALTGYKGNRRHKVAKALGWAPADGTDLGSTADELCVFAQVPLSFRTSAAQWECNIGKVRFKHLRGLFELWNSICNFFSRVVNFCLVTPSWTSLHHWHDWQQSPSEKSFLGFYCEGNSGSHSRDFRPQSWPSGFSSWTASFSPFSV